MRRTCTALMLLLTMAAPASAQMLRAFERETALLARTSPPAAGQEPEQAWERVRDLRSGKKIRLGVGTFEIEEVRFLKADDSSLTVRTPEGSERTVLKSDVREIRNPFTYYARQGMLWGLLGGSLVGLMRCQASTLVGLCAMFGGGIGMGLGAGVGGAANHDAHENALIYRRAY
jgi:hypothetical protein